VYAVRSRRGDIGHGEGHDVGGAKEKTAAGDAQLPSARPVLVVLTPRGLGLDERAHSVPAGAHERAHRRPAADSGAR